MSEVVLQQSRLLCYFQIDKALNKQQVQAIFEPETLPLLVYHYHYPAVIYPLLYRHFRPYFDAAVTEHHLRIKFNNKELPSDLPMGLFLSDNAKVVVTISGVAVRSGFKMIVESWKRGYTIVNENDKCNYVNHILNEDQQRQLYELYVKGHTHGLNKIPTYEGNRIAVRIFLEGNVIERKQAGLGQSIRQFLMKQFGEIGLSYRIATHGIEVDLGMNLKQLLEEWNYGDGYCYLKIVV